MRPAVRSNGSEYCEYILLYTDDVLAVFESPKRLIREGIGKYFELKQKFIGPSNICLGGKMRKVELKNEAEAWSFSSSQCVQAAVENVETHLKKRGKRLPARAETPLRTVHRPELDTSPELDASKSAYFQSLIEVLR